MKKVFWINYLPLFALLLVMSCAKDHNELNIESIAQSAILKGRIIYNTGANIADENYQIELKKPAEGKKVFVEISYDQYKSGATGNKIFETVTDTNGEFQLKIQTPSTGLNATIRFENFVSEYKVFDKMDGATPLFKSKLKEFFFSKELTLMPSNVIYLNDLEYTRSNGVTLDGFDKETTLVGNLQIAYEQEYRTGAYKAAENRSVELSVNYEPTGLTEDVIFGATTDASGNFKLTIPVRSLKDGFKIKNIRILGNKGEYNHFKGKETSVRLEGAYKTEYLSKEKYAVSIKDIIEGVDCNIGKQHLIFTPNYNYNLPTPSLPESWNDNLAGWVKIEGYDEYQAITGSAQLAIESGYAQGGYKAENLTIQFSAKYTDDLSKTFIASTDAQGLFTVNIPVKSTSTPATISEFKVIPLENANYIHYKTSSEQIQLQGDYSLYTNIKPEQPKWHQIGDHYYKFTPQNSPPTFYSNLLGWIREKDYTFTSNITFKVFEGTEIAYLIGNYQPAANRVITISIPNVGEAQLVVPANGTVNALIPVKSTSEEPVIVIQTEDYKVKDYQHYSDGASSTQKTIEGTYTKYLSIEKDNAQWNNLGELYFTFTPQSAVKTFKSNLAGWVKDAKFTTTTNITGKVFFATETKFRNGTYNGANNQPIKVIFEERSYVGATDSNGNYSIPVIVKHTGYEASTSPSIDLLDNTDVKFTHYVSLTHNEATETLTGAYSKYISDRNLTSKWNEMGSEYFKFEKSSGTSPTNWSDNLVGWYKIPNAKSNTTIKGSIMKAIEKKSGSTWEADWANDNTRMVGVTVNNIRFDLVSTNGAFSFSMPITGNAPDSYSINIHPSADISNISFNHYETTSATTATDLYGKYKSASGVAFTTTKTNNVYEIAPSAKMLFTPASSQALIGWNLYDWTSILDK